MKLTYLLILVCQIPFFSYAENSKNIVNHDSCFVISGSGYSYIEEYKCKSKHVVIPSTVNGNTIFGISRWAFDQMDIESVELPETIRYIGDNAFSHNKLKIIRFSSNIISIGFKAFAGNELVSVHFPEKAKISEISYCAFCGNNLEKILIPESVNLLEGHAFDNNPLNRIVIPSKVVIERYALPEGFVNLYENNSLESGEYELINYNWVRSAEYP